MLIDLVTDLGAIGDGTLHPLSERYATLAQAQQRYPAATSLDDSIDWAALQTGVDGTQRIYVPVGDFVLNKEIVVGTATRRLLLEGNNSSALNMSRLIGDPSLGDRPMFRQNHGWVDIDNQLRDPDGNILPLPQGDPASGNLVFNIRLIYFEHRGLDHAGIIQFNLSGATSIMKECYINNGSGRGIVIGSAFGVKYDTCRFVAGYADDFADDAEAFKRTALWPGSHSLITNCDFVRCGMCVALSGPGINIVGGRYEVNIYGIVVGELPTLLWQNFGDASSWRSGSLDGVTLEQNRYAIRFGVASGCRMSNLSVQGSTTPGGVTSKVGIEFISNSQDVLIQNTIVSSDLDDFQNYVFSSETRADFKNVENITSLPSIFNDTPGSSGYDFKGVNRDIRIQAKSDLVARGLTQLALDKQVVFSRKLAGVEVPGNGATSVSVVFLPTLGTGTAQYSGPAVVETDVGSTLPPNDYEYATTLLNRLGETGIDDTLTLRTVTVAAQERVTLNFSVNTNSSFRRIYRRIVGNIAWEAYFEFDPSLNTFVDTGQTEDGVDAPPSEGSLIPTEIEDDANYYVTPTPSWLTTFRVTNKLTTGFDIEFGTPAPTGSEEVAWLLFRV